MRYILLPIHLTLVALGNFKDFLREFYFNCLKNSRRTNECWSLRFKIPRCPTQWDEDLSEMAQAWADQCALVEYSSGGQQPKRLFHDARAKRDEED